MAMAPEVTSGRLQNLSEGFNVLTEEYQRLWIKSQALERSLQEARSQFESFVAERGVVSKHDLADCPLEPSLSGLATIESSLDSPSGWWRRADLNIEKTTLRTIQEAADIARLRALDISVNGQAEKITSQGSSTMPSISESTLEQDFTTSGTPSKLGCPFTSMRNRALSSHAASVVSKYRPNGTVTPRSGVSRINGKASSIAQAQIVARPPEICGAMQSPRKFAAADVESVQGSAAAGLCPIRFLEKSSPEEVAAYFEEHKHELPRSHEICVKRYQSNADSIRELDAKYGSLVSMIQGLGQKHQPMLPRERPEYPEDAQDQASTERVRKWATNISEIEGLVNVDDASDADEERVPHFDRPMRDVRIGESPSRPWGIQVPITALEKASKSSSVEVAAGQVELRTNGVSPKSEPQADGEDVGMSKVKRPAGKCPFHFDAPKEPEKAATAPVMELPTDRQRPSSDIPKDVKIESEARPIFINAEPAAAGTTAQLQGMTFTGPVFIGYSAEQAIALLKVMKE